MLVRESVIRRIGNSAGVIIPKEMLEKYDLKLGDKLFLRDTPDGILLSAHDPLFAEAMEIARQCGKKYGNALRELSKR